MFSLRHIFLAAGVGLPSLNGEKRKASRLADVPWARMDCHCIPGPQALQLRTWNTTPKHSAEKLEP